MSKYNRSPWGRPPKSKTNFSDIENKSLQDYYDRAKQNWNQILVIAGTLKFLAWMSFSIKLLLAFLPIGIDLEDRLYNGPEEFILLGLIFNLFLVGIFHISLNALCKFVEIQLDRITQESENSLRKHKELVRMTKKIADVAAENAQKGITVNGDFATFSFDSSSVTIDKQTKTISGSKETMEYLALLIEYCRASENRESLVLAEKFVAEATSTVPDKGTLFQLWNGIVASIPRILEVTKIANGIKQLMI